METEPLTNEQINLLVAEKVMGREVYRGKFPYEGPMLIVPGSWGGVEGYGMEPEVENCPDYVGDIRATYDMEAHIGSQGSLYEVYVVRLSDVVSSDRALIFDAGIEVDVWEMTIDAYRYLWMMVTATPKQRCLAALLMAEVIDWTHKSLLPDIAGNFT